MYGYNWLKVLRNSIEHYEIPSFQKVLNLIYLYIFVYSLFTSAP